MLKVDEGYVFFDSSEVTCSKDVCYVEYSPNILIDLDKAIKICSIRRCYESYGYRKFLCKISKGVSFSRDATMQFGRYDQVMNIHFMAVYDEDMGALSRYILNFIHRSRKRPITRYFKNLDEAKKWIVKQ